MSVTGPDTPFELTVYGKPQPAGSKTAYVHPHTKQIVVTDANSKARTWKDQVAQAAGRAFGDRPIMTGAVTLDVTFFEPRPKGHYGTGRNEGVIKDSAPEYPTKAPDTTKLVRGTEDAMSGIVYRDDSQVVDLIARKRYGAPARCEIVVTPKPRTRLGDADYAQPQLALAA